VVTSAARIYDGYKYDINCAHVAHTTLQSSSYRLRNEYLNEYSSFRHVYVHQFSALRNTLANFEIAAIYHPRQYCLYVQL